MHTDRNKRKSIYVCKPIIQNTPVNVSLPIEIDPADVPLPPSTEPEPDPIPVSKSHGTPAVGTKRARFAPSATIRSGRAVRPPVRYG